MDKIGFSFSRYKMPLSTEFLEYVRNDQTVLIRWNLGEYIRSLDPEGVARIAGYVKSMNMVNLLLDKMPDPQLRKLFIGEMIRYGRAEIVLQILREIQFTSAVVTILVNRLEIAVSYDDPTYYDNTFLIYADYYDRDGMVIPESTLVLLAKQDRECRLLSLVFMSKPANCPRYPSYPNLVMEIYYTWYHAPLQASDETDKVSFPVYRSPLPKRNVNDYILPVYLKKTDDVTYALKTQVRKTSERLFNSSDVSNVFKVYLDRFPEPVNESLLLELFQRLADEGRVRKVRTVITYVVARRLQALYLPIAQRINTIATYTPESFGLKPSDAQQDRRYFLQLWGKGNNPFVFALWQQKMLEFINPEMVALVTTMLGHEEIISQARGRLVEKIGEYNLLPVVDLSKTAVNKAIFRIGKQEMTELYQENPAYWSYVNNH